MTLLARLIMTTEDTQTKTRPFTSSTTLAKASLLLRTVARIFPTGGTLSRIAREVRMNTATAHRLLTALAHEGLLNFDPYAKTYHVGFELLQIAESAQAVAPDLKLRHHLRPMLASIAWRTEESTYLSILANRDSVCIDLAEGTYPISANTLVAGARRPLGIGAGAMALLAALPQKEGNQMVTKNQERYERYSGITPAEVGYGLSECRRLGFAFNSGRIVPEVAALGVAFKVPGSEHRVAISVASVVSRMHVERRQLVIDVIRDEIRQWVSQTVDHRTFKESCVGGGVHHSLE
jgi:DNA-binding IclR family transcriptional regulator